MQTQTQWYIMDAPSKFMNTNQIEIMKSINKHLI